MNIFRTCRGFMMSQDGESWIASFPTKILVNCWWTKSYLQLGWSKICQLNLSDIWYVHINCSSPWQVGVRRLYFMILWSYSASLSLVPLDVGIQIWSCVQGSSDHHNTTHLKHEFFSVAVKKPIRKISLELDCEFPSRSSSKIEICETTARWWFQPIWKILVKLGIFPK